MSGIPHSWHILLCPVSFQYLHGAELGPCGIYGEKLLRFLLLVALSHSGYIPRKTDQQKKKNYIHHKHFGNTNQSPYGTKISRVFYSFCIQIHLL